MRNRIPLLTTALALAALLAFGCTESPDEAGWNNPLDPDGVDNGDPFHVAANFSGGLVYVSWSGVSLSSLAGYEVLHALEADGTYAVVATTEPEITTYAHADFAPNSPNYYKVRAVDAQGNSSASSHVVAASLTPPTDVQIDDGLTTAITRHVELSVRSAFGESAEIDSLPDFSTSISIALDDEFGATTAWDLGPAVANGEMKHLYVRVHDGGDVTAVRHDSLEVAFAPALDFEGAPTTLASRTTPLAIGGSGGVVEMRFAPDLDALELAASVAGGTSYEGYELSADPDTQMVYGEFWCDFGFSVIDSVIAVPDSLALLELTLNTGLETITDATIPVTTDLQAAEMRFATDLPTLAVTPWLPYDRNGSVDHDGCASGLTKTVYAEFRNDWFSPAPTSATIIWTPPEVLGAALTSTDAVVSGEAVTLTGTAQTGTCDDPLTLVEVDTGDGWTAVTGLDTWTYAWTAPTVTEATTATIDLRATAGAVVSETTSFEIEVAPAE